MDFNPFICRPEISTNSPATSVHNIWQNRERILYCVTCVFVHEAMVCNAQVFCTLYNLANKWINCMLSSIVRSESCWWTRNDRKSYLLKPYTGLQHKLDELQFISTLEKQNPTLQHKHWNFNLCVQVSCVYYEVTKPSFNSLFQAPRPRLYGENLFLVEESTTQPGQL